jgi:gliding motility-associated-like protein
MKSNFKFFTSCILCLFFLGTWSQPTFEKTYGSNNGIFPDLFCNNICYDNSSNSLLLGTGGYNVGSSIPGVTKLDTCGNVIWSRQTSQSGTMFFNTITTYSGNTSAYFSSDGALGSWIGTIADFNSTGSLTAVNTVYTSATAIDAHPVGAKRLANGDHLITGYASRTGNFKDIWFAKIGLSGSVIWSKLSGQFDTFWENGWGIDVNTTTNEYYFVGQNISFSTNNSTDIHIIKTDQSGNIIWEKQISSPGTDVAYAVKVMPNNEVIIAGNTDNSASFNQCITLIRLDAGGNLVWSNVYNGLGFTNVCRNINILPNGNILLTGYTDGYGPALLNGLLMEVDGLGNIVWQNVYGNSENDSFSNSVIHNNSIYTAGSSDSTSSVGKLRAYLVKTNLNGTFNPGSMCVSSASSFTKTVATYSIYNASNIQNNFLTTTLSLTGSTVNANSVVLCGQPTASFTPQNTVCTNQAISLLDQSLNGVNSWTWTSSANNISNPFLQNQASITFTAAGTYTLQLKVSNCIFTDSIKKIITVSPGPPLLLSSNSPICAGTTLSLSAASTSSIFSWIGPNGFINNAQNPFITNAQTINSGIYYVSAGQATNGCVPTGTINIVVSGLPNIFINISGVNPLCLGGSLGLSASGATNYTWLPSGITNSSLTITPAVNTSYTVIGTNVSGCINKAVYGATVNTLPLVSITGNSVICSGKNTNLTALGANSYTWSNGALSNVTSVSPLSTSIFSVSGSSTNGCINTSTFLVAVNPSPTLSISGPSVICVAQTTTLNSSGADTYLWNTNETTSSVQSAPTTNTLYSVIGTNAITGCSSTAVYSIIVNTTPTITIAGPLRTCSGKKVSVSAFGALSYTWNTGITLQTLTFTPNSNITLTVIGSNSSLSGCTNTTQYFLTVDPTPSIVIIGNYTLCSGSSATLTATGGDAYVWSTGSSGQSIIVSPFVTTTYTVTGAVAATGCSNTANTSIKTIPYPAITISGPALICKGQQVNLTASGAVSYTWNGSLVSSVYTDTPSTSSMYTITGSNSEGCLSSNVFSLNVSLPPIISISGNTQVCQGQKIDLTADGANSYLWDNGVNSNNNVFTAFQSKEVYVIGFNIDGCANLKKLQLKVNPLTKSRFTVDSVLSDCFYEYRFVGASDPLVKEYYWYQDNKFKTNADELVLSVNQGMSSEIALTLINIYGCKDEAKRKIQTDNFFENLVYIPNSFTPNGDGRNDEWGIVSECLENSLCLIYNRWGHLVCKLKGKETWDGTFKGLTVQDNIYVFKLSGNFYSKKEYEKTGIITLYK